MTATPEPNPRSDARPTARRGRARKLARWLFTAASALSAAACVAFLVTWGIVGHNSFSELSYSTRPNARGEYTHWYFELSRSRVICRRAHWTHAGVERGTIKPEETGHGWKSQWIRFGSGSTITEIIKAEDAERQSDWYPDTSGDLGGYFHEVPGSGRATLKSYGKAYVTPLQFAYYTTLSPGREEDDERNGWRGIRMPAWFVAVALACLPVIAITREIVSVIRARARRQKQRCLACGYDLRGTAPDRPCPECGAERAPI